MEFIKNFNKNKETLKMLWTKVVRRIEKMIDMVEEFYR